VLADRPCAAAVVGLEEIQIATPSHFLLSASRGCSRRWVIRWYLPATHMLGSLADTVAAFAKFASGAEARGPELAARWWPQNFAVHRGRSRLRRRSKLYK
jgi:hypothetical protein